MRVDLHLHTTASDGHHAPVELVRLARVHSMDVIAITDHDTTAGIAEALAAANGSPLVIPGIELSAEDAAGDVHMLGYGLDTASPLLQERLAHFRDMRLTRGQRIVDKLAALGMPVAWERVVAIADGGSVGRPHIARTLVEAGYVESVADAFARYLYNGGPAYVARARLTPEEAIALIHAAGGAAVLAHPGLLADPCGMVERLVPTGLDGVEVVHPKNPENVRLDMRGMAKRYDLVMTGGSDFHGKDVSTVIIGGVNPPEGCVAQLRARAARYAIAP